ncbi:Nramp-domain-containing protein [Fomitiporia mediterranea MF3/22]|uniref:Nramp-domain-containing protein n=1 Tax=Fomitiporia mediterranea (strain MF3/22) TaxID=694068 RepID=UPI0004407E4A|nr:Nramp-domain-containing protein [Fomitiporia mediterranea MF3/22]EJD04338.1 Nramp-domain-containing protein [Fomitiporia mediterranea MF3/22]
MASSRRPASSAAPQRADGASDRRPDALQRRVQNVKTVCTTVGRHMKHHFGVGIVCAVAYFDPGNWSTDLLAGSQFGYKLLFVVLLAGLGAVVLQILSCKLGCVTGLDLASHCRLLMHDHPRYPRLVRYVFLYPLYVLSELAIVSTDIAELLGSAIGLVLLIPSLPLPVAVLLTATDVIFILAVGDPTKGRRKPVRIFEMIIIVLVLIVFCCFIVLLVRVRPHWPDVFAGYLPSKGLAEPSALYAAVGIIGATVMPHALYLGSHLATHDRVNSRPESRSGLPPPSIQLPLTRGAIFKKAIKSLFAVRPVRRHGGDDQLDTWTPYGERKNNTLAFVKAHYTHGIWDLVVNLLGFAVLINSAILILSSAVFFFGPGKTANGAPAGLFDAFDLIRDIVGRPAAVVFAIALISSGQSASITATLAGQIVSEGFIQWSISPFLRRLVTRLLGLIPSMLVAIIVGRAGIDTLLVISQVVLSIVLPFVMFPLVWLTSSSVVMRVQKPRESVLVTPDSEESEKSEDDEEKKAESSSKRESITEDYLEEEEIEVPDDDVPDPVELDIQETEIEIETKEKKAKDRARTESKDAYDETVAVPLSVGDTTSEYVDYSNGWPLTILSYAIWIVILIANGYLIVTLAID